EVLERDHRVVARHQDVGRDFQRGQALAGDRVAVEVGLDRAETGVALRQPAHQAAQVQLQGGVVVAEALREQLALAQQRAAPLAPEIDRKSTGLNSSHVKSSYAVFCL